MLKIISGEPSGKFVKNIAIRSELRTFDVRALAFDFSQSSVIGSHVLVFFSI